MNLTILDLAEDDLLSGFRFYERRASGVGWYFVDSLFADIESLRLYAGVHLKFQGFHRMLSRRFPFAVYYRVVEEEIQVWRVLDCRRDPAWIRRQLRKAGSRS